MKNPLYNLRKEFSKFVAVYRTKTNSPNYASGTIIRDYDVFICQQAIAIPATLVRKFSYDLSFVAANKNFTYGGLYGVYDHIILLERGCGPIDLNDDDQIIIEYKRFQCKKIEEYPFGYIIEAVAVKGEMPYEANVNVLNLAAYNNNPYTRVLLDILSRSLRLNSLNNAFYNVFGAQNTLGLAKDLFNLGTTDIDTNNIYKPFGLRSGLLNENPKLLTITYPIDDLDVNSLCFSAFIDMQTISAPFFKFGTSEIYIDNTKVKVGDREILYTCPAHAQLTVNVNDAGITLYCNGQVLDSLATIGSDDPNLDGWTFEGDVRVKHLSIGPGLTNLQCQTLNELINNFNKGMGRNAY